MESGESGAKSNGLRQAIKSNSGIVQSIMGSDRFYMCLYELLDGDYVIALPNKRLASFFGLSVEELSGRKASELSLPADHIRKFVALSRLCRDEAKTVDCEQCLEFRGRETWYEGSVSYIEGSGNLFIFIAADITERKKAEKSLSESEEKYRLLAEVAPDMIYLIDGGLCVKYVNQSAAGALGMAQEDAAGKPLDVLFPEETAGLMKEALKGVMASGKPGASEVVHQFHRRSIPMHVILAPLRDGEGKVSGVMGISRDITDLKKVEEALQESERTKRTLMDGIPEALLLLDRDGIILDANSVLAGMIGRDKSDLPGTYAYELLDAGTAQARKDKIDGVFRSGQPAVFEDERAGTCFENIITPILSKDGTVDKVAIIAIDITERKRTEAALRDAKQQAELYLDLLGHDINNMHQIALGYLELARDRHPDSGQQELLDKPIEALQRSARLIQNVRKLQKLREDALASGTVDVAKVLADVRREYGDSPGKAVRLDLKGHERCHVRANELLRDVFANLVSNAVNHTGKGTTIGIVLETTTENGGRFCRVCVEDDGPGIPDDLKDKIFNRKLKGSTRARGMGLGLYLVRSLVESFGGRVWVEDRVKGDHGQGARFVVLLPLAE